MSSSKSNELYDRIVRARVKMLLVHPFFGQLSLRLKVVDGSGWINTLATDGKHIYFNADFVSRLNNDELIFGVGHEVEHCIYEHIERHHVTTDKDENRLWNMAEDYVINLDLVEAGCGKLIHHEPKFEGDPDACVPCYDVRFAGMSSEQVYWLLKEEQKSNKHSSQSFDVHIGQGKHIDENGCSVEADPTGYNGPIPMTADEIAKAKEEILHETIVAAKNVGVGSLPAGLKAKLAHLLEPKMNWREFLNVETQSLFKSDFTFSKPNRRASSLGGIILPAMDNDYTVTVDCAIDCSGSMSDAMLVDVVSEVAGIMQQFSDFVVRFFCFDTKTYTMHTFTPDNIEDLQTITMEGGGGTDFSCIFQRLKEDSVVPDQLIVFTDGHVNDWGDDNYCKTIFLIHSNDSCVAPYGQTIIYSIGE